MSVINLIWAQSRNGVIGHKGALPWHLPEDLKRFRDLTLGDTVIMGRKTWESLPPSHRPLKNRQNVVLTRQAHYATPPGVQRARDVYEALTFVERYETAWVIGGKEIYDLFMPLANHMYVTEVQRDFVGDVDAPMFRDSDWVMTAHMPNQHSEKYPLTFDYQVYKRIRHVAVETLDCCAD